MSFRSWLDHKLKVDVYELRDGEIVRGRGSRPQNKIRLSDVKAWQIYPEMGFDIVDITLADGRRIRWFDKYDDLTHILRRAAPSKEWAAA